ncbi:hypothetical protein [Actinoplanes sp. NPDC023714]|uniref:hypothetical protein n=1 Tax=Actinoplanes sp. NPDC023714 TaxID=3154322 RepID=UPI00340429F6
MVEPTTIRVMVFGEAGAGKTVYLAGMFRQLSVARPDSIITLHTREVDRLKLNRIYTDVVNPRLHDFPATTTWVADPWHFTCQFTNQHGTFYPMAVEYLDYDGRMLDPIHGELEMSDDDVDADPGLQQLYAYRDRADAYLILIDGLKLLRMLCGAPELEHWLENYLGQQLQVIERRQDHTGRRPPLHLVITKWDLLDGRVIDGEPVTLDTIAQLLTRQGIFADHLERRFHDKDRPVRLIPVSVTGPFAAFDEQTGRVVKVPGQPVIPCNVDIPFAALLPDILRWRLDQMVTDLRSPADERTVERLRRSALLLRSARGLTDSVRSPLGGWITRKLLARGVGTSASARTATAEITKGLLDQLGVYFDNRERLARERLATVEEEHRRRLQAITTEREAFALMVESYIAHLDDFEDRHPGSVLTAGVPA